MTLIMGFFFSVTLTIDFGFFQCDTCYGIWFFFFNVTLTIVPLGLHDLADLQVADG